MSVAEAALATKNEAIAKSIITRFLQTEPQADQYFCRARLSLALILDIEAAHTNGSISIRERKIAMAQVLAALDVAVAPENIARYKFLVFNCTATGWKIVHPFLRSGRAKFFIVEMQRMSNALEAADDPDIEW